MPTGYTPWLPPRFWEHFKERHRRLFTSKLPLEVRAEVKWRMAHRIGQIRSARFSRQMAGILKELYSDEAPRLVFTKNPLLEAIGGSAQS